MRKGTKEGLKKKCNKTLLSQKGRVRIKKKKDRIGSLRVS